ncbi:two-component system, chemotaxis family, sensor histidine kinase and response regulator WspE [Kaistia soli DSM 19436]|uniref:Chemotaxis protein CheA n=1 Tax=Kaistia soli DSM 19436 TaxID=1122133 RepID=A0A1M4TZ56_9HYPH|nr:hybrid sensor histidine kinase/response regulator [Kaistia soli]SHE49624.1 two-component system, chemotaxis family, sensor histidine kinase and response regulator WspE [Kaistia soli DSM 19436]
MSEDLSQFSLLDLFRAELQSQSAALTDGLLALERDPISAIHLEACMRAAHSLKGAARIIDLAPAVRVAHVMEECLVAAQHGRLRLGRDHIDILLQGVDLLALVASGTPEGGDAALPRVAEFERQLEQAVASGSAAPADDAIALEPAPAREGTAATDVATGDATPSAGGSDRMVRITAEGMNRLLGLAGESLMEARRLRPFADALQRLKRHHASLAKALDDLRATLPPQGGDPQTSQAFGEARDRLAESRDFLADRLAELDAIDRRATDLANRLYAETIESRMRPFEDGVRHYSRMVRDLGRALGKTVSLEIVGGSNGIDRDILDQLDAPLGHLLRNAVDHGLEMPEERIAAGKPPEGVIRLEARHNAGLLQIIVADDGRGIDIDRLRRAIVTRNLTSEATAASLSEAELLAFLFLPGFSMKPTVTDISGRGVGLDAVQSMAKQVRGVASVTTQPGTGTQFQLQLPLTLSVVRTLLVEIAGEPYAFPLAGITRTLRLPRDAIEVLAGRPHFRFGARQVGLITAHELLERGEPRSTSEDLAVVVIGEDADSYGLIVDRFLGERELVVRPLDPRLSKVKDVSAAALMEDGSPVLIIDIDDLIRSAEKLAGSGRLRTLRHGLAKADERPRKRILVVDDSLTVRELERKLLDHHGYEVEVAVDGMDGWNAVRADSFDLVVTDVDMPRMDGIELVTLIKQDGRLRSLPVMIVSYKDREEDRRRGLDAGADYYLTKGSFHDETLIHAVADLIGEASE